VKPQGINLDGVSDVDELVERVLQMRLSEVHALEGNLNRREKQGLHDFRIACKRLRYALERFGDLDSALQAAAEKLALLQDALGEAHDRDVLLAILPAAMAETERRLKSEREACVDRAISVWSELQSMQALDSHRI
jgi:CHAD domain-containing protein